MALLECRGVSKAFGGLQAVKDVSFEVRENSLVSLIGPNGAGKTTLFNCVAGLLRPDAGEIRMNGRRIDGLRPDAIARAGLVRTFQNIRMFPGLTVFESLVAAQHVRREAGSLPALVGAGHHRSEWRTMASRAAEVMGLLGLYENADAVANDLPLLDQRKIEIGRAILANPTLILLDEPTAGATAPESEEIKGVMRHLLAEGITIVLIEHSMRVVMSISEVVHVMNFGELIASGTPHEVSNDERVQAVYLGTKRR